MDTYQAIYDAVASKINNGDIGQAVEQAIMRSGLDHQAMMAVESIRYSMSEIAQANTLPSVLYRPVLSIDGNQWCALYGKDLVVGVCGFGDTPEKAINAFNKNWLSDDRSKILE